ncbi:MAG: hypothetical protein IKC65_03915 [Lentisphaeria bacterium]|nr:hypothetical protein [Lentisphaeria bacterium]
MNVLWHVRTGKNPVARSLKYSVTDKGGFVDTGKVRVKIARGGTFFTCGRSTARIILTDEQGKKQLFVPADIRVEEAGQERVTLRLEGDCGDSFKTVVRLGLTADSPVISLDMRFINDVLKSEFTDIASLELFLDGVAAKELLMDGKKGKLFFQHHDQKLDHDGRISKDRLSGNGSAGQLRFRLRNFWQKYPKSVSLSEKGVVFGLLPRQPGKDFNKELPFYLYYPFCGGFYRTKWGMAFSEKLQLDFSGQTPLNCRGIVPVIDRDYLASTEVFQGVPDSSFRLFELFDRQAEAAFKKIEANREKNREYGFMNWGDSFGERGMNWNNNEYDLARGLFQIFLRNGNRDLYRYALTSIRHQADADIIHASIIRSNIGGQHQHGIGHSGPSWHHFRPLPWSYPHDANSTGLNGHTWTEGMLTGWCLAGEPFVMDSAHLMAAHYVNYTCRTYVDMRNNERSIGWALRAVMPFYRISGDKKYLQAAKEMVDVVKHEYEPAHGGAWPHRLRGGHANGHKDAWGGCPFMVGVLLEGLRQYQLEVKDPEVEKMIQSGARWLYKSYSPADVGWPYGASWEGKGYHHPMVQCNFEVLSGMLYGLPASYSAACDVIGQAALGGISSVPKNFSMVLNMSAGILDGLCRTRPDLKAPIDGRNLWKSVASQPSMFKLRGPVNKKFNLVITGKNPQVIFLRTRYGGRPNGKKSYTVSWGGHTVTGKTATAHADHKIVPSGKPGTVVPVEISDDLGAYWDVKSHRDLRVEAVVVPGYHLVADGTKAYCFRVPAGTEKFSVKVMGTHPGGFAAAILDPEGRVVASVTGRNDGDVQLPWVKKTSRKRPERELAVTCSPRQKEEIWKLVILSGGGAGLAFEGIPGVIFRIE